MSTAQRGRGECRVPIAPAASCAMCEYAHELFTADAPGSSGIPHAMVLTAYFALSPGTGLFCHRRSRISSRELDASVGASGPHDFAVRISAPRLAPPLRPPHPASYVRDDRDTPLVEAGHTNIRLIWVSGKEKYFCGRGWTGGSVICPPGKITPLRALLLQIKRAICGTGQSIINGMVKEIY